MVDDGRQMMLDPRGWDHNRCVTALHCSMRFFRELLLYIFIYAMEASSICVTPAVQLSGAFACAAVNAVPQHRE